MPLIFSGSGQITVVLYWLPKNVMTGFISHFSQLKDIFLSEDHFIRFLKFSSCSSSFSPNTTMLSEMLWVGVGGFSKVVATFNHVGGSLIFLWPPPECLNNPIFSNLGLCAVCWAHFMCHHELWPTLLGHPFSFLNSSWGLTGRKHYQKITTTIFKILLFQVTFLVLFSVFFLTFFWLVCYCRMWLYFSLGN